MTPFIEEINNEIRSTKNYIIKMSVLFSFIFLLLCFEIYTLAKHLYYFKWLVEMNIFFLTIFSSFGFLNILKARIYIVKIRVLLDMQLMQLKQIPVPPLSD